MVQSVKIVFLLAVLLTVSQLFADGDVDHQEVRRLTQSGKILPLTELLTSIQESRPGRVIEVELERKGRVYLYEIEMLDDQGVVWEYKLDAVTGEILELEVED
ncbi:MAG: PepSY domain-containing protein [Candidatus Thiodiazotropha sp. (ex. Lucinisca nassula)]|nr:PepSY domain-containing protein [Candidatus Thiodiazotropha sp. (ex. Lucinisca nassula)]MBW9260525.1 PepSY domain-containing protein [Candidatus Thiodiazotropha sp. (ex. Lucinisca nassula)]